MNEDATARYGRRILLTSSQKVCRVGTAVFAKPANDQATLDIFLGQFHTLAAGAIFTTV